MAAGSMIRFACQCAFWIIGGAVLFIVVSTLFPQINVMMSGTTESNTKPHVIVVGGGLAGISAAIEASRHGAEVTVIEKEKGLGGNSAKATSGINGVGTEAQGDKMIEDSLDLFNKDTLASGEGQSKAELVQVLARNSAEAHVWLKSFGLNLTDVVQLGGHSTKRTHRFPPTPEGRAVPVGFTILNTLKKHVENDLRDSVTPIFNAQFKKLLMEDESVVGVQYQDVEGNLREVRGQVVLAAGGYANDHTEDSLLAKYAPELAELPTTNGDWATGDIIKRTSALGFSLVQMDKIQIHPTGFVEPKAPNHHTKFLAPEALRGCGAILLNAEGKRFVNELGRRNHVTDHIFKHCQPYENNPENPVAAAMLLTQEVIDKFGPPSVGFYRMKGLVVDHSTLDAIAERMGIDVSVLRSTIKDYREAAAKGEDVFGKKAFPTVFSEDDHYFLAYITPTLHYCMGGIEINMQAEVLRGSDDQKSAVAGLFAAGEVSGGVHGVNRLGGNSLLECVVFGRMAGRNAAHT